MNCSLSVSEIEPVFARVERKRSRGTFDRRECQRVKLIERLRLTNTGTEVLTTTSSHNRLHQ